MIATQRAFDFLLSASIFIPGLIMQGCGPSGGDYFSGCQMYGLNPNLVFDDSVGQSWRNDFEHVFGNVQSLLKVDSSTSMTCLTIQAWMDTQDPPAGLEKGQYLTKKSGQPLLALEVSTFEIENNHPHRLSVIAHELYHWYQFYALGDRDGSSDFRVKWIIEGAAATFESMYLAQYHGENYWPSQLDHIPAGDLNPADYEKYETQETNYGYSVYMALILAKRSSFTKLFVEFWNSSPLRASSWEQHFQTVFGITVHDFYNEVRQKPNPSTVIPAAHALSQVQF